MSEEADVAQRRVERVRQALRDDALLKPIPCGVPGVIAVERHRKGTLPFDPGGNLTARDSIVERLYVCPNGWSVGCRRGGRLHLADKDSWEMFVLDPRGVTTECEDGTRETVGWVDEATLERAVARLVAWFDADGD